MPSIDIIEVIALIIAIAITLVGGFGCIYYFLAFRSMSKEYKRLREKQQDSGDERGQ